jgi:hypothetical protein
VPDGRKKAFVFMTFDAEMNEVYTAFLEPILSNYN